MQSRSLRSILEAGTAALALVSLVALGACQSSVPTWEAVPDGPSGLDLLRDRSSVARLELICWGPNWRWFHMDGKAATDANGVRTAELTGNAAGKPVKLTARTRAAGPRSVIVEYEFSAPEGADLTAIVLVFNPARDHFDGGKLVATLEDGTEKEYPPSPRVGVMSGTVRRLCFRTAEGEELTIDADPPRAIASDNGARLILVGNRLEPGETRRTAVTVTAPAALRFVSSDAEMVQTHATPDWFPYPVGPAGVPVDLSFLNKDAQGQYVPAGAHGFVRVKDEDLAFEDGTPARFWGANVTAYGALASPERAAQIAERLARLGCNIARLHHLDSFWGPCIIDKDHPDGTTRNLDTADMQRLDRLLYELKQRGIYVNLDPWVGREYRAGDGIPGWDRMGGGNFGLHPFIFFDLKMQQLHREFLQQVWGHVNEYTGLAYRDDPAIVLTEFCNEALFDIGKISRLEPYRSEFIAQYKTWATQNGANPDSDVVGQNWPRDHQRFYIHILRTFYSDLRRFYREELGVRIPIIGSNWFHFPWEIVANAGEDVMDAHHYYGGDQVGPGSGMGGLWVSQKPNSRGTPFGKIGAMAILGKPLSCSECGNNPPKTYRSAYYPGLAAVACLQGWDVVTPYAFTQSGASRDRLTDFEMEADPATVASLAVAALIFRRGDVQPGRTLAVMALAEDEQFAMHWENDFEKAFENTGEFNAALETRRVRVVLGDRPPEGLEVAQLMTPASSAGYSPTSTELRSDTGELWRDWRIGVGTIDTPRTQAAYGRLGESGRSWDTSDCSFTITTPYAMVSLSSLTDTPLAVSNRLLLTAVARAENTGQAYNLAMTRIVASGSAPILAEPVAGSVTFRTSARRLTAWPVQVDGTRGPAVEVRTQDGRATLEIGPGAKTVFYVIEAEG